MRLFTVTLTAAIMGVLVAFPAAASAQNRLSSTTRESGSLVYTSTTGRLDGRNVSINDTRRDIGSQTITTSRGRIGDDRVNLTVTERPLGSSTLRTTRGTIGGEFVSYTTTVRPVGNTTHSRTTGRIGGSPASLNTYSYQSGSSQRSRTTGQIGGQFTSSSSTTTSFRTGTSHTSRHIYVQPRRPTTGSRIVYTTDTFGVYCPPQPTTSYRVETRPQFHSYLDRGRTPAYTYRSTRPYTSSRIIVSNPPGPRYSTATPSRWLSASYVTDLSPYSSDCRWRLNQARYALDPLLNDGYYSLSLLRIDPRHADYSASYITVRSGSYLHRMPLVTVRGSHRWTPCYVPTAYFFPHEGLLVVPVDRYRVNRTVVVLFG